MTGEGTLCYFSSSFVADANVKGGAPYWKSGPGLGLLEERMGPVLEETTFGGSRDGYTETPSG